MILNKTTHIIRYSLLLSSLLTAQSYADEPSENATVDDSPKAIESILVTGSKIARTVQETTTSVAVLTAEQMEKKNINNFVDSLNETPNAFALPNGTFSIRGIDGFNVSGSGTSFLASVYLDGAPLPQRMIQGGGFSTWDAQQVEILRGPQSTLQGRNALAGSVIMSSNEATFDWNGIYKAQVGELGEKELGLAFGGAIVNDLLAFRVSAEQKDIDGQVTNVPTNRPSDYREEETYRAKILLSPESIPEFNAQLSYINHSSSRGSTGVEIEEGANPFKNKKTYFNDPKDQFVDGDVVALELNYELDDYLTASSHTTWSDVDYSFIWDADTLGETGSDFPEDTGGIRLFDSNNITLSQEFRLTFEYENFSGVAGAYYYNDESIAESNGLTSFELSSLGLTSSFLQAAYGLDSATADFVIGHYDDFNPAQVSQRSIVDIEIESYALFFDAVWNVSDNWDIYGGLRWDKEEQNFSSEGIYTILNADALPDGNVYNGTAYELVGTLITGLNSFLYTTADEASQAAQPGGSKYDNILPKLGVSYHWSDDLITSFTVQQGYRSGGVAVNSAQSYVYDYEPEFTVNYEFSIRSTWLDKRLTANANVFYIDWTDQQVLVQLSSNTFDTETVNAGSSEVTGFELELNYQIDNEWAVYGSIGRAKSEFTDFVVEIPTEAETIVYDLTGRSFADAPEWTANAGFTFVGDNGWYANLNINYADSAPTEVNPYIQGFEEGEYGFDMENDGRTLVNTKVGYEWDSVGVYLIGKNLTDEEYITSANVRTSTLGYPRQFSISVRGSF
ncbi:MAG: TonB-dependent receptor [Paraglaciecola sp.]|uniref:TonB-dependent receptor n=1 Tax=Paraglaciecola sp. TaxID=1920173 RepID=UPI00329990B0